MNFDKDKGVHIMGFNFAGRPKPVPKEEIVDEVLGKIKVFNDGLLFESAFFPNYENIGFRLVTEDGKQIPAEIGPTKGFDVDYDVFIGNKEKYLTHIKRIHSFEKNIMDAVLERAQDDVLSQLDFESEEFNDNLSGMELSVTVDIEDIDYDPDNASLSSYVCLTSENNGAVEITVKYNLDLKDGKMEGYYSDTGHY